MELIKGHDGPKVEEGEVEVVLEQLYDTIVSIFPFTVFQSEAHTSHYGEATTSIEENVAQLKVTIYKPSLFDAARKK